MNVIKTNRELADTLRRVARSYPSHKLDDIVDLHTCANIIANMHKRPDQGMDQPHHGHDILEDEA